MLSEAYRSKLRHHVKTHPEEWDIRAQRFARHLLAAVAFRESAQATMEQTGSVILTPIGFYYSLFHLGVAALTIDHRATLESLRNMRHKPLLNRLNSTMRQPGFVSDHFISTFKRLKNDREYANYQFSIRLDNDFFDVAPKYYLDTESCFQDVRTFFLSVAAAIDDLSSLSFRVQVGIADGFGDDILQTYLSDDYKRRVNQWLTDNNLQV